MIEVDGVVVLVDQRVVDMECDVGFCEFNICLIVGGYNLFLVGVGFCNCGLYECIVGDGFCDSVGIVWVSCVVDMYCEEMIGVFCVMDDGLCEFQVNFVYYL